MRKRTIIGCLLISSAFSAAAQTNKNKAAAVYISAGDIQAPLKSVSPDKPFTEQAIRTVAVGKMHVGVAAVHRPAGVTQTSVAHDELTEIYHILTGSGTLVTGGALVKPESYIRVGTQFEAADRQTIRDNAGPSTRGAGIENGVSRKVRAGDVVIIPAGAPHWFSSIDGAIEYEVMRIDPGGLLSLK